MADPCKIAGCGKRRLGSSELCPDHLNERLRLERDSREKVRGAEGNWAAWSTPEPTLAQVAGRPETPEERAAARARENLVRVRGEVRGRLASEAERIPWPSILSGFGPAQLIGRLEKSLAGLSAERELEAWRGIDQLVQGTAEGRADALSKLDATIREPLRILLQALGSRAPAPAAPPAPAPAPAPDEAPPPPIASTPAPSAEDLANAIRDAVTAGERILRQAGDRAFKQATDAAGAAAGAAGDAARVAAGSVSRGPQLDLAGIAGVATDAAASFARALTGKLQSSLVRYATGGRVDPDALKRATDDLARMALGFMYRRFWRVETAGMEHVPARGPAIILANRSGVLPWDAAMVATAIAEEHPSRRRVRLLVLDWLAEIPRAAETLEDAGLLVARTTSADRFVAAGEVVVGFDRSALVTLAQRTGAPLVPCGVTPSFMRLPSPWKIRFGPAIRAEATRPHAEIADEALAAIATMAEVA